MGTDEPGPAAGTAGTIRVRRRTLWRNLSARSGFGGNVSAWMLLVALLGPPADAGPAPAPAAPAERAPDAGPSPGEVTDAEVIEALDFLEALEMLRDEDAELFLDEE